MNTGVHSYSDLNIMEIFLEVFSGQESFSQECCLGESGILYQRKSCCVSNKSQHDIKMQLMIPKTIFDIFGPGNYLRKVNNF